MPTRPAIHSNNPWSGKYCRRPKTAPKHYVERKLIHYSLPKTLATGTHMNPPLSFMTTLPDSPIKNLSPQRPHTAGACFADFASVFVTADNDDAVSTAMTPSYQHRYYDKRSIISFCYQSTNAHRCCSSVTEQSMDCCRSDSEIDTSFQLDEENSGVGNIPTPKSTTSDEDTDVNEYHSIGIKLSVNLTSHKHISGCATENTINKISDESINDVDNEVESVDSRHEQQEFQSSSTIEDTKLEDLTSSDVEYQEFLQTRHKIEEAEHNRQNIRGSLESYINSLSVRKDEDGDQLLMFPKNYKQILSLMTINDIQDDGSPAKPKNSWYKVLIQNGLSKIKAFGEIHEENGEDNVKTELAAKIAMKSARIRKLDKTLEELFGGSIYGKVDGDSKAHANMMGERKPMNNSMQCHVYASTKKKKNNQLQDNQDDHQNDTELNYITEITPTQVGTNHVMRNKLLVQNGGKGLLTHEEEIRLQTLMVEQKDSIEDNTSGGISNNALEPNAFTMSTTDKDEIETLLASIQMKDVEKDCIIIEDSDSNTPFDPQTQCKIGRDGTTNNRNKKSEITKKEVQEEMKPWKQSEDEIVTRQRNQRLMQIDSELAILQYTSLDILPNEDPRLSTVDLASEYSCNTSRTCVLSMISAASNLTRISCASRTSISRQEFNNFLSQEIESTTAINTFKRATSDDIKKLLSSLPCRVH